MRVDLTYSEEQTMFADMVERLLVARYGFEHRRRITASDSGEDPALWTALAELGCFGLPIAPEAGGFGGSMIDVGILMEAIGRHLVTEPVLASAVLAGRLAVRAGALDLVEPMVAGTTKLAFADGRESLTVHGDRLSGAVKLVSGAGHADMLLVAARVGEVISLYAVSRDAAGLSAEPLRLLDGARGADLRFEDVPGRVLLADAGAAIEASLDDAVVASGWEALGSMSAASHQTSAYMRERRQFGRPLGDFQVVQHRIAEMAVAVEEGRAAALLGALALDAGAAGPAAVRAVSGMKVTIARCARIVAQGAVQLHGGMGVSEELPIAAHFRTLLAFEIALGTVSTHLGRYADSVLPAGLHRTSAVLADAA